MRREIYAARLQTALEAIVEAGSGMGMNLSMPATRHPEMRMLQFVEQLAGEMTGFEGADSAIEQDDDPVSAVLEAVPTLTMLQAGTLVDAGVLDAKSLDDVSVAELEDSGISPASIDKLVAALGLDAQIAVESDIDEVEPVVDNPDPDAAVDDADRIEAAVGEANAQALADAGYDSVAAITTASDAELDEVAGIGPATITKLREAFS